MDDHAGLLSLTLGTAARTILAIHHDDPHDPGLSRRTRYVVRTCLHFARRFHSLTFVSDSISSACHRKGSARDARGYHCGGRGYGMLFPAGRRYTTARACRNQMPRAGVADCAHRTQPPGQRSGLFDPCICAGDVGNAGNPPRACRTRHGRRCSSSSRVVNSLGLAEKVRFLGPTDDPVNVLQAADVFCLSSRTEALPVSLLEAMACGVVPVVTDVGDCRRVVGGAGYVVPSGSPQELGEALVEALSHASAGPSLEARNRVIEHYGDTAMVSAYATLYSEVARSQSEGTG